MPSYNICGVAVDFPFEAYTVQLVYMEKVVLALQQGENALLESPTGTGKTLCLLCAVLGWRRAQVEKAANVQTASVRAGGTGMGDGWAVALQAQFPGGGAASGSAGASSTGQAPRVIYASRTHSQLQQVVHELRRTVHRPRVCVLGSREQLCCHPDVSSLPGAAQTPACQALTAADACKFYRKLQHEIRTHRQKNARLPHPQAGADEATRPVPDIEDFVAEAKRGELCPFYLARELQESSEVLFMPYNYLLDAKVRRALDIDPSRDVLIV